MNFLEKVCTSKPINKTSKIVTEAKGVHFNSSKKIRCAHSRVPIAFITKSTDHNLNEILKEIVGFKFGRLTVLGAERRTRKKYRMYVCKCCCGMYTKRKYKAIKNPKNNIDCCEKCRETEYLKRHADYLSYGNKSNNNQSEAQ